MKKLIGIALIFASLSLVAQEKKDVELKTNVSEATVFIKGAQALRKTTATLPAGKSTLRFVNLSPYIDAKSIQVKIDGEVMVLSVNHQQNYNDTIKQSDEIEKLRKQLSDLDEKIKIERTNKEVVAEEIAFLKDNRKIGGNEKGIEIVNLKATDAYYSERISALKMKDIELDKKINNLSGEKSGVERKMAVSGSFKPEPTGEVILNVESKIAQRVPIELSYYVNNASWHPSYDIRAKTINEPIELTYKANIIQNTKEDWKNIKLKISSANPKLGNVAPKLKTYFLNYYTQPPRYNTNNTSNQATGRITDTYGEPIIGASVHIKGSTIGTVTDLDGKFSLAIPAGGGILEVLYIGMKPKTFPISNNYMNIVLEEEDAILEEVVITGYGGIEKNLAGSVAGISDRKPAKKKEIPLPVVQVENQTSVEFEIKTPYSIPSENKPTTVEMERYSVPADYEYYCVPKVDKDAFLLAYITNWEQYNLQEGEANIFFENTFIGKTILDVRYMSDTLNISLGRDKSVTIQRDKVKEYNTQKFLGSKTETTRDWKVTVRNNKRQPISIVLFDQIPVSTTNEIEVNTENLTGGILNDETGEVKWKLTLQPAQKNELNLRYKVKYPKGRSLTVE
ncbi:MAG: mucoidy inhibitor MuiA family protein [Dysgonamonadaceae bacterium]|jgi:hypothetical protein|nr:mucoidy inhibitor MuiA family protein [Dysgonamonadaceae bacterium]